jgi:hypothetical protein
MERHITAKGGMTGLEALGIYAEAPDYGYKRKLL